MIFFCKNLKNSLSLGQVFCAGKNPFKPIKTYKNFEDTASFIIQNPKALALYYFGDDKEEMNNVLDNTSSGQAVMNDVLFQFSMHDLPFGGVGPSGMGAYHGHDGFKNFSHKRSVLKGQNILAVSYTHLTLPTKRIV